MKTELEIAKENIKWFKKNDEDDIQRGNCLNHKATCQRFLEFLEGFWNSSLLCSVCNIGGKAIDDMNNKYRDLNQAIKLYNEAGV